MIRFRHCLFILMPLLMLMLARCFAAYAAIIFAPAFYAPAIRYARMRYHTPPRGVGAPMRERDALRGNACARQRRDGSAMSEEMRGNVTRDDDAHYARGVARRSCGMFTYVRLLNTSCRVTRYRCVTMSAIYG